MKTYILTYLFLIGCTIATAQTNNVHSCFGKNLVEQINAYQAPNLVKSPTQTFNNLAQLQNKINSKTDHNGAIYALTAGTHNGSLKIVDKRNLCIYTDPNNPATINATNQNFGINAYNSKKGVNSNIKILNFRITGAKFHGIYLGGDDAPCFAPRGTWVAGNKVFDVAQTVGGGIVVRNGFEGATIKIESNEVYNISLSNSGSSGEGIYIGEGNDPQDYSSDIHIIGNYLHDLTGEAIDIKRKSANILMEYNRINNINVKSQAAVVLGLDPGKANDTYDAQFIFRRNTVSNVTKRAFDGNFIVVSNGSTLIEENVMWIAADDGIDVYADCDGPNKNIKIRNNIIWGYTGLPVRVNVGNANNGTKDPCSVVRTTNIVQNNPVSSECKENATAFTGPLSTFEGFSPVNTISDHPDPIVDNSISWNPTPSFITSGTNQIPVKYSINQDGLVAVQLFNSSWDKIGEKIIKVSNGVNQQISVDVKATSTPTNPSFVQAKLIGRSWEDIGASTLQKKVGYDNTSNPDPPTPVENSIDWNQVPVSVTSGSNQISVKYSINQDALVVVQLFNSRWEQIGQQPLSVSAAENKTVTLTLKPNQTPTATNYLQAKLLSPNWEDIGVTFKQAEVTSNVNGKIKNEEMNNLSILPNPFKNQTLIQYQVENSGPISISIHSADGKQFKKLVNDKHYEAGNHQFFIDGTQLSTGMYFIHFTSSNQEIVEKLYKY